MKRVREILICLILLYTTEVCDTYTVQLNTPITMTLSNNTSQHYKPIYIKLPSFPKYGFVIPQVHTQYKTVVSSMKGSSIYGYENNSTDSGIIMLLQANSKSEILTYVGVNSSTAVKTVLFTVPSVRNSPVPGACCLTCSMEIDPNIQISYDSVKTHIQFSRASKFWDFSSSYPKCDDRENPATFALQYDIYYYYLDENDLSDNGLFEGLWKMSSPESIKNVAQHLVTMKSADHLQTTTETVFAQGVIFNVIVTDKSTGLSTAYVPTVTYACNFTNNECKSFGSKTSLTYCILFALFGLVMCFAGFKLLRVLLFASGIVFYWFIIFVLLARYCSKWDTNEIMVVSSVCSLVGGAFVLFMFAFKKLVYLCLLNVCIALGLFISAIIFYTPFGYLSMWNVDYQFALGYFCIILFISAILLFYPKTACYLFSTVLGSYAVIMLPNYLVRANMQYIVVTVILRLTVSDFGSSYLRRPYQTLDIILTGSWAALFLIGYIVQYCTTKNDDFVVSGKEIRQKAWQKFSESVKITKKRFNRKQAKQKYYTPPSTERTPLLTEGNQSTTENLTFNSQPQISNTSTFHPQQNENDDADLLRSFHSHESKEYQPLIHQPHQYGALQPSAPLPPPPYNDDRYPKIV